MVGGAFRLEIGDWASTDGLDELYRQIRSAGMEGRLAELDAFGFTIVEDVLPPAGVARLAAALVRLAERKGGAPIDVSAGTDDSGAVVGAWLPLLLAQDPAFLDLVADTRALPLVRYLLGRSATISAVTGFVRGRGVGFRALHCDDEAPDPLPRHAQTANVHWLLSDYTESSGPLSIVPGSHRRCRAPIGAEGDFDAIPVFAPAGSIIVFHGNTWHGAFERSLPGLRLTIACYYVRGLYRARNEPYAEILEPEVLERLEPEVRRVLGAELPWPWRTVEDRYSPDTRLRVEQFSESKWSQQA